jgi:hypothetical protein
MKALRWLVMLLLVFNSAFAADVGPPDNPLISCITEAIACRVGGRCDTNVLAVLRLLRSDPLLQKDLTEVNVLYLTDERGGRISAFNTDQGSEQAGWSFHVILQYRGDIIDPDYASSSGKAQIADYFSKMFRLSAGENKGMTVQTIPATDYLNEYGLHEPDVGPINTEYYRYSPEANERYPRRLINVQNPALSISRTFPAQDLMTRKHDLMVGYGYIKMFEGGSLLSIQVGKKGVQVEGKRDPLLIEKFLSEIREQSETDPVIREIWKNYKNW